MLCFGGINSGDRTLIALEGLRAAGVRAEDPEQGERLVRGRGGVAKPAVHCCLPGIMCRRRLVLWQTPAGCKELKAAGRV